MALKTKKKSLADKINSLVTTTPATFNSDDEADEDTKAKVVDHYDDSENSEGDFQQSIIRRRNVDLLDQIDERYKGKKVSRKDVYDDSPKQDDQEMDSMQEQSEDMDSDDEDDITNEDSDFNSDEHSAENDGASFDSNLTTEEYSEDEEEESSIEDNSTHEISDPSNGNDIQTIKQTNLRAEIEKGNCVRNQLKLWENLLEIRIKLQKCLITSNQMPQYDTYKDFKTNAEYAKTVNETKNKLKSLLNNMLQVQSFLLKQYPETKHLSTNSKKRKAEKAASEGDSMDEEIPSDTEDENEEKAASSIESMEDYNENTFRKKLKLSNYEKILNDNHNSYVEYRNSVIQKWNEKTRLASGKLNKGANESTLKQIEFAISDKDKLRKRSRLKRSEYKIIGKGEATDDNDGRRVQEYDSEIYDDDDFYHQLLRDLIEYKSSDITDPIQLSKQWVQLQNMRSKMKRKIDTRATKGRRIRYNVHNKLVNFMAPIVVNDTWTDHAKDELYNSLFGKIKTTNTNIGR